MCTCMCVCACMHANAHACMCVHECRGQRLSLVAFCSLVWLVRSIHSRKGECGLGKEINKRQQINLEGLPVNTVIHLKFIKQSSAGQWWCTPLIPTFKRQRQTDYCEFKASLVYKVNSKTSGTVCQRNSVLKKNQNK